MKIVANMIVHDEPPIYLEAVIPALRKFCDSISILFNHDSVGYYSEAVRSLLRPGDTVFTIEQGPIVNYSEERNIMLVAADNGDWVLKWDPDELPSDELSSKIWSYVYDHQGCRSFMIPIYHIMKSPRECLPLEYGGNHLRLFQVNPSVRFYGSIHEQPSVQGPTGVIPYPFIHFSYFCENRLSKKAEHYASIPTSGFQTAQDLTSRLTMQTIPLPDNVTYTTPPGWLEVIRYAT
jgi:hypothetical protein